MRAFAVLVAAAVLAAAAPPAEAAGALALDLAGGDWAAARLAAPVRCAQLTITAQWHGGLALTAAVFLLGPGQSASALVYFEGSSVRVLVATSAGTLVEEGFPVFHGPTGLVQDLSFLCGLARFDRIAYVVPDAAGGRLDATLDAAPAATTWGGADAVGLAAHDFAGARAEADARFGFGASAAVLEASTTTARPGLVALYATTANAARLEASGPGLWGTSATTCASAAPLAPQPWCSGSGQRFHFLGFGDSAFSPAGTYRFGLASAAAQPVRAWVVGAPVAWT